MNNDFGIYTDMYNSIISDLESGNFLPNMKAIRQQIREAKKSIDILTKGSIFCQNLEMLEKTERKLQLAKYKLNAMNAVVVYIKNRQKVKEQ